LQQDWVGSRRVFLFVSSFEKAKVDVLLPAKFVVAEVAGKYIYSNQP